MKTIRIKDGHITIPESKATCKNCGALIPFDKIEKKYMSQTDHTITIKCKCGSKVGIAVDMRGDYVSF